ncbi:MAG: protein-glutamate O-methyltransferase CheR [Acidobacteriota bacterium]|jgi:chemotaxis protein methyltransferase CheR|nr:MAG: chemotaxis protein CheR [Acidobacteriota bacterium]
MTTPIDDPPGPTEAGEAADDLDLEIDLLLEAIVRKYSYEFRDYARASLRRRIRGALDAFGFASVSELQHHVLRDRQVFTTLLSRLTVTVSAMFRDPGYYLALRREVLPMLATWPSLKIWVAGCSTGEEVYSLTILLDEAGLLERTHIYATDINPEALRTAAAGVYPLARLAQFTRNYQQAGGTRSLADYYTAAYGNAAFDRRLRARVTFSDHSLATDQVFAEVQFVSCRNVLIYFNSRLQDRAIGLFHDSLVMHGFLALGSHERVEGSTRARGFRAVSRKDRIYQKVPYAD